MCFSFLFCAISLPLWNIFSFESYSSSLVCWCILLSHSISSSPCLREKFSVWYPSLNPWLHTQLARQGEYLREHWGCDVRPFQSTGKISWFVVGGCEDDITLVCLWETCKSQARFVSLCESSNAQALCKSTCLQNSAVVVILHSSDAAKNS